MSFFDTTAGKVIGIVVILAIVGVGVWFAAVRMAPATDSPSDVTNLMPPSDPNSKDVLDNNQLYGTPPPFPGAGDKSRR
ncbi:MAG: hypothetical protein AMXMBFR61_03190 [Fimbriimonadales bacterium]